MTVYKDTRELARQAVAMSDALLSGGEAEVNDTESYDNGVKVVPAYLLDPVSVDGENYQILVDEATTPSRTWAERPPDGGKTTHGAREHTPMARAQRTASEPGDDTPGYILRMRDITKTFPGVRALDGVSMSVRPGEIHAICGENGAGKSTLMKVLSGVHPHGSYEGDIEFDGETCAFRDIRASERRGIVIIHQELALIPQLSIAENIFLGNERTSAGEVSSPGPPRCARPSGCCAGSG